MDKDKDCEKCKGTGIACATRFRPEQRCHYCLGNSSFPDLKPQVRKIVGLIRASRGPNKGQFRSSRPPRHKGKVDWATVVAHRRAYFVWRLARFHGGADVCMPMMAEMAIEGDPYHKGLDLLAEAVARKVFGTDMAATARWGAVMGYLDETQVPEDLPASAYAGGPVADGNKPDEEALELL